MKHNIMIILMDVYQVLDCALRTRFVTPEELPRLPIWHRLPDELRDALSSQTPERLPIWQDATKMLRTLATDPVAQKRQVAIALLWAVSQQLVGSRNPTNDDRKGEELSANFVWLYLGLIYDRYLSQKIDADELLLRASRAANSYICGIDDIPFVRARRLLCEGGVDAKQLHELFEIYHSHAENVIGDWGLRL